jgi:hypothetical protein
MNQESLERIVAKRATLLGVGPMSINCVDSAIEVADEVNVPLMLIASRRQIDSIEFGGGYVNNWCTKTFSEYVFDKDKKGNIILARDHGGPWQNPLESEKKYSLKQAMESAKRSYREDIDSGFQIIHIDPSVDIWGTPTVDSTLDRIFELYEFCWGYAQSRGQKIMFEIGTEEQSGSTNTQDELDYTLNSMMNFCKKYNLPRPLFVVVQNGTRVLETGNVGSYDVPIRVPGEIAPEIQIPKMIEICNRYGVLMKAHNTDYLSNVALQWYPRLGIHAANVAPEFGVVETRSLVKALEANGLEVLSEQFLDISYKSGKWKKWMKKDTFATDRERAMISGHYIFSSPQFKELKLEADKYFSKRGLNLNEILKMDIKLSINRYLSAFRLTRSL